MLQTSLSKSVIELTMGVFITGLLSLDVVSAKTCLAQDILRVRIKKYVKYNWSIFWDKNENSLSFIKVVHERTLFAAHMIYLNQRKLIVPGSVIFQQFPVNPH
jgi:hypothetical protein